MSAKYYADMSDMRDAGGIADDDFVLSSDYAALEAERDALREALTEIVCISDYELYDECTHSIPLEDCHKLAKDAIAATE